MQKHFSRIQTNDISMYIHIFEIIIFLKNNQNFYFSKEENCEKIYELRHNYFIPIQQHTKLVIQFKIKNKLIRVA